MTLEEKAEEYAERQKPCDGQAQLYIIDGYLKGAEEVKADCDFALEGKDVEIAELEQKLEQTEKDLADYQFNYPKIKELEQENNKLLDVINNQDVKIADLEKQIEKMKCCEICNHNRGGCSYHHNWTKDCLKNNHKYFELKE